MESSEINLISAEVDDDKLKDVLESFMQKFGESFNLIKLTTTGQWTLLWNNLFDILLKTPTKLQLQCLQTIRILSRDKTYLNETINEEQFDCLLELASIGAQNASLSSQHSPEVQTEALKILCNLVFQSPKSQEFCLKNSAVEGILKRLRTCKEQYVDYNIKYFDMKLLFLITALTPNVRIKVRDFDGLVYLVETLDLMMKNTTSKEFEQQDINLINEILKVLFNITVTGPTSVESEEDEDQHLQRLAIVLHDLLQFDAKQKENKEEYHSNIVNLLTNIPVSCYSELVPSSTEETPKHEIFENIDMHAIVILLKFLELRLNKIFGATASKDYEQLPPILTVIIKSVRCTSTIRRFVRSKVLPPMSCNFKKRPEEGTTLRNHLCKLLTYPSTQISDLVAELLFVLCKENVGRMIKYTGYGNAAGLFAKKGLLGGRTSENQQQYSSDSEDSDTEEYKELLHGINPVIGCYEPPKKNPFEGMSEEQKEYEAEKLANLIDQLDKQGIIKPCKINEEGKPIPVNHVLELQSEIPEQQRDFKKKT
ncbi:hypothetical protein PVAND_003791 [Polypedilum vanderplanki]|uniref:Synembryn-A n=1 Tax=Polypedilum vanderplanki TaxID=319348 RepID=A0A9J6BW55_POLVA|nr:hypothetical protein PVAND_003791 [Polypedilum vanderplanki]